MSFALAVSMFQPVEAIHVALYAKAKAMDITGEINRQGRNFHFELQGTKEQLDKYYNSVKEIFS